MREFGMYRITVATIAPRNARYFGTFGQSVTGEPTNVSEAAIPDLSEHSSPPEPEIRQSRYSLPRALQRGGGRDCQLETTSMTLPLDCLLAASLHYL